MNQQRAVSRVESSAGESVLDYCAALQRNPRRLSGIVAIHDTDEPGLDLGHAGVQEDGSVVSWHVTDEPDRIADVLERGAPLVQSYGASQRTSELGPGLYGSAAPQLWTGRARNKWEFLDRLDAPELGTLLESLRRAVASERADRYIGEGEFESAWRLLDHVADGAYTPRVLVQLAGQPYNIRFWEPAWLEPLGLPTGRAPRVMRFRVQGRLADVDRLYVDPATLRALRHLADGAYARGVGVDQLVVWNNNAIVEWTEDR